MSSSHHFMCNEDSFELNFFVKKTCSLDEWNEKSNFSILGLFTLTLTNLETHCFYLSLFASFIAPLGGFFASAFKRAIGIKDFGKTIPGHGGITDRMDCQFLMGMFTYVYTSEFLFKDSAALLTRTMLLFNRLSDEDKSKFFNFVKTYFDESDN